MSKENLEKVLYDWRVVLLAVVVAWAIWTVHPNLATGQHNLKLGFELVGGARAILQPENTTSQEVIESAINVMQNRLNIYGVKEVIIRPTSDLEGNRYITVEAAGMSEEDIEELLAKQGKLDARIENETVFIGTDVLVEAYNAGVRSEDGGVYRWFLPLRITSFDAKVKFANVTANLDVAFDNPKYLEKPLDLYIDGKQITSLQIAADLKGKIVDNPVIEGSSESRDKALTELNRMKAIVQTGALPVQLKVMSIDRTSPSLGESFINQVWTAAVLVLVAVTIMLYAYYRDWTITGSIVLMSICAIVVVLGISSWINWQMDIPSIAGLIVAVGVGIDQQVIITDQVLRGEVGEEEKKSLLHKLKDAGFIIIASFGTTVSAMLPLLFVGLGALRGFAITTLLGEAVAFLFTRPAYLKLLPALLEK